MVEWLLVEVDMEVLHHLCRQPNTIHTQSIPSHVRILSMGVR
jgi:hypothetical protein